jgi:lipoprotein-anchoring transpeptidase ErfK/SrfK
MLRATILSILLSIGLPNICYADNKLIKVDLTNFHWEAFINNQLVREGKASGGRKFCPDIDRPCKTPSGTFKVISKKGRWYRSSLYPVGCKGIDCAPMPFAIKLLHSGMSIHGAKEKIEQHISHSCIHLSIEDSKWINQFVSIGTPVIILPY